MRTFVAAELPSQFEGEVAAVARQLSAVVEARYIPRENHKVTLFKSTLHKDGAIYKPLHTVVWE